MPFSPPDISSLWTWQRAQAESAYADGDPVSTAADQSGNARTLTGTTTTRPTYKTGILNGKAVYRFDGVDDFLKNASALTGATGLTVALAARLRTLAGYDMWWGHSYNTNEIRVFGYSGQLQWLDQFQSGVGPVITGQTCVVVAIWTSATSWEFRINRAQVGLVNTTVPPSLIGPTYLGAREVSELPAALDLGEHIIYTKAVSGTELTNLESYLYNEFVATELPSPVGLFDREAKLDALFDDAGFA